MGFRSRKAKRIDAMTVFEAFPNAIETGWKLALIKKTVEGTKFIEVAEFSPIVDDGSTASKNTSPEAEGLGSDRLLYVEPSELPTVDSNTLCANYGVIAPDGDAFEIAEVGVGKNQETGKVEHVEIHI